VPLSVRVYANKDEGTSLLVKWAPVDTDNGAPVLRYSVEYTFGTDFAPMQFAVQGGGADWPNGGSQNFSALDIATFDALDRGPLNVHPGYAVNLTNLTCGVAVAVRVRAHNRQGAGGPVWYSQEGMDDATLALPL